MADPQNPFPEAVLRSESLGLRNLDLDLQRMMGENPPIGPVTPGVIPEGSGPWRSPLPPGQVPVPNAGNIHVQDRESERHTDQRLLNDLTQALTELGLTVTITDAARSAHAGYGAKNSRHIQGKALDIGLVNGKTASLANPDAVRLVQWFISRGYVTEGGGHSGGHAAFLFGPIGSRWNPSGFDHSTHIHLSVP